MVNGVLFKVQPPLGVVVRTTKDYWNKVITEKHPGIKKYEERVKETLQDPDEIRQNAQDSRVYLHYKNIGKVHVCVVADYLTINEGYLITTYLTDHIREGKQIYVKPKNIL